MKTNEHIVDNLCAHYFCSLSIFPILDYVGAIFFYRAHVHTIVITEFEKCESGDFYEVFYEGTGESQQ